jgi:hypothetical protein
MGYVCSRMDAQVKVYHRICVFTDVIDLNLHVQPLVHISRDRP